MTNEILPYNPLDKKHLGESVAEAMLKKETIPLGGVPRFKGAGTYAIYYTGDFPCYVPLGAKKDELGIPFVPIYVGKAVPPGARKGNVGLETNPGTALWTRLKQHAKSIDQAVNLDLGSFLCRHLVVEDIWIPLGEALLIARFSPVWNKLVDGFGNHDPGKGRHRGLRPRWDVLHPGRSWAVKCQPRDETPEQIISEIDAYFQTNLPA